MSKSKEVLGSQTDPEVSPEVLEPTDPKFTFSAEAKALVNNANTIFIGDNAELVGAIRSDDRETAAVFAPLLSKSTRQIAVTTLGSALDDLGEKLFIEFIRSLNTEAQLAALLDDELS